MTGAQEITSNVSGLSIQPAVTTVTVSHCHFVYLSMERKPASGTLAELHVIPTLSVCVTATRDNAWELDVPARLQQTVSSLAKMVDVSLAHLVAPKKA